MGLLDSIFGKKLKVPKIPNIDFGDLQQQTVAENLEAQPQASELAARTNQAAQRDALTQLENIIPGVRGILSTIGRNIQDRAAGRLPDDVVQNVLSRANAAGLSRGFLSGSGQRANLGVRDLGLTSLQISNPAANLQALGLAQGVGTRETLSAANMFLTPSQRAGLQLQQNQLQFNRNLAAAQANAAPSPIASGIFNTAASLGGSLLGNLGGGRSGGGQALSTSGTRFGGIPPDPFKGSLTPQGTLTNAGTRRLFG